MKCRRTPSLEKWSPVKKNHIACSNRRRVRTSRLHRPPRSRHRFVWHCRTNRSAIHRLRNNRSGCDSGCCFRSVRASFRPRQRILRPFITSNPGSQSRHLFPVSIDRRSTCRSIRLPYGYYYSTMKTNYHTHTTRCMHAVGDDEDYVRSAIKGGFQELGFSDHGPWKLHTDFVRTYVCSRRTYRNI